MEIKIRHMHRPGVLNGSSRWVLISTWLIIRIISFGGCLMSVVIFFFFDINVSCLGR